MARSLKEKKYSKRWMKRLNEKYGVFSHRIVDTPFISPQGPSTIKKPFDAFVVTQGVAIEFKFKTGLTMNLKRWKENKKTRHQYWHLTKFAESESGIAVLFVFWKKTGTRAIQEKWEYVEKNRNP